MKRAVIPFILYLTGLGVAAAAAAVAALEPQDMCTFAGLGNCSFAVSTVPPVRPIALFILIFSRLISSHLDLPRVLRDLLRGIWDDWRL
jgi:hypothetical protein